MYIKRALLLLSCFVLWNCSGGSNTTTSNASSEAADSLSDADKAFFETTQIKWIETEHDFGSITEGAQVEHRYHAVNIGTSPLLISNASASCGCTIPNWPKEPISVGDTAEIFVEFNSEGRVGKQNKRITISTNTSPNVNVLILKGEVQSKS